MSIEPGRGIYDTERAAALSGVPRSTLHYWAREGILIPSVSLQPRTRLWSWGDLLALRTIDWLRHLKPGTAAATQMRDIRAATRWLSEQSLSMDRLSELVVVMADGKLFFEPLDTGLVVSPTSGQSGIGALLGLVRPYGDGPDLLVPRPQLRIIPGKLSGEPHIIGTRITSLAIQALANEGYSHAAIRRIYPQISDEAIDEAVSLERSLAAA